MKSTFLHTIRQEKMNLNTNVRVFVSAHWMTKFQIQFGKETHSRFNKILSRWIGATAEFCSFVEKLGKQFLHVNLFSF